MNTVWLFGNDRSRLAELVFDVRRNAIEVLENKRQLEYVPLLTQRARSSHNRERANAIKAMHKMKVSTASSSLMAMLQDERAEHRISAMWALRLWQLHLIWNTLTAYSWITTESANRGHWPWPLRRIYSDSNSLCVLTSFGRPSAA